MGFNCGIVGLPNVGKSTLFNALTSTVQAEAANYPFCTVEPNVGMVEVPDERLRILTDRVQPKQTVPALSGPVRRASARTRAASSRRSNGFTR